MTALRFPILAFGLLLLSVPVASAQYRGGNGEYRRPNIGLPNPLSNPYFNYWYHNAPRYWNGSAWMVTPMPQPYYGVNPYGYHPYFNPAPIYNTTVVNPTVNPAGQAVASNDIHIYLPDPNAKVFLNGTLFDGFGTDRHLTFSNLVVGAKHEVTVKATWNGDGRTHSKQAVVTLDGTGHATLYWFDAQ